MEKEQVKTKESLAEEIAEIEEKLNKKFALGPGILANLKGKIQVMEREGRQELNAVLEAFLDSAGITALSKKELAEARKLIVEWAKNQTTEHL